MKARLRGDDGNGVELSPTQLRCNPRWDDKYAAIPFLFFFSPYYYYSYYYSFLSFFVWVLWKSVDFWPIGVMGMEWRVCTLFFWFGGSAKEIMEFWDGMEEISHM